MSEYIKREDIFSIWRSNPKPASVKSLVEAINQAPAADVLEVRHGEWIFGEGTTESGERVPIFICSECGSFTKSPFVDMWDYCPACGAKMNKEA